MVYLGADNNLENSLLSNASQLKNGYAGGCNVIVYIDRSEATDIFGTSPFGEKFYGCRMYRLEEKKYTRLYGNENFSDEPDNSANAKNLAGFISYCKENYPADKYVLFLGSHGSGCDNSEAEYVYEPLTNTGADEPFYSVSASTSSPSYSFIVNQGSEALNDWITPSELSSVLGEKHYVDIMAFDICYMGNYEFLYEISECKWCPKYVVATPTTQGGAGYYYKDLIRYFTPSWHKNIEVEEYALFIMESYRDYTIDNPDFYKKISSTTVNRQDIQICTVFEMGKFSSLKTAVDSFAKEAYKHWDSFYKLTWGFKINEQQQQENFLYYTEPDFLFLTKTKYSSNQDGAYGFKNQLISCPYVDIYDLALRTREAALSSTLTSRANLLMEKVNEVVLDSFAGSLFPRFEAGASGLSIWFPKTTAGIEANPLYYKLKSSVKGAKASGVGNWYNLIMNGTPAY